MLPADGATAMVKLVGTPAHPLAIALVVMVAVCDTPVLFVEANEGMLPVPEAPRPMAVLLFVHERVVPATELTKFTADVIVPAHSVWLLTAPITGLGLTVMRKVMERFSPAQPVPPLALTVTMLATAVLPLFTAWKEGMAPTPLAGIPVEGLEAIH